MTSMDELLVEWYRLKVRADKLEEQMRPLEKELLDRLKVGDEVPVPKKSVKIVKRDRRQLVPDMLQSLVTEEVWEDITVPMPVAILIEVAVKRGQLERDVVDRCYRRTRPWLSIKG